MANDLRSTTGTDHTPATMGLLVAAGLAALPQLGFAAFLAVNTWIDTTGMSPRERSESWAELAYFFAAVIAVPPVVAGLLAGAAWATRQRAAGVGYAICALCVAGVPAAFYLLEMLSGP